MCRCIVEGLIAVTRHLIAKIAKTVWDIRLFRKTGHEKLSSAKCTKFGQVKAHLVTVWKKTTLASH